MSENAAVRSTLERAFQQFDTTNDGELNLTEFTLAVETFGFGELGHEIFQELDRDKTGTISYREILVVLQENRGEHSRRCQQLLTAMSFDILQEERKAVEADRTALHLEFSPYPWSAETDTELRDTIRERMLDVLARPWDIWYAMLAGCGSKRRLSCEQFQTSLKSVLGYNGPATVAIAAYKSMDDDDSNELSLDEFQNWINCKPQRRKQARMASMASFREANERPLEELHWTPAVLRRELQTMLTRAHLSALDLLMAYDKSDNGILNRKQWYFMLKRLVGEAAWEAGAREIGHSIFETVSGGGKEIDIEEIQRWLVTGRATTEKQATRANLETKALSTSTTVTTGVGAGGDDEGGY